MFKNISNNKNEMIFPFSKNTILIVDDESINLFILDKLLKKRGFQVEKAKNGMEAIEAVKENNYEVVLMDLMMPGMDGFEACKKIHKMKPYLPVIILTAMIDAQSMAKSFKSGAVDYIKKPLDEVELFSRLHNAIILKRAEERYVNMYKDMVQDLDTASEIQASLLPSWFFFNKNLIATSLYEPSHKIGGDLFDIISIDEDRYVVYMGDISGHGVQAALLMASVKSFIYMLIGLHDPKLLEPHYFVTKLNKLITQRLFNSHYLTFVFMLVDTKQNKVRICNAGHPPLFLYEKEEIHIFGERGGFPLGWLPNQEYKKEDEETIDFFPDSCLFLYTDGIFECIDKHGEQLGIKGLKYFFKQSYNNDCSYFLPWLLKERLMKKNYDFGGDDFTLLYLENKDWSPIKNLKAFLLDSSLSEVGKVCSDCEKEIIKWTKDENVAAEVEIIAGEYLNNIIVHGMKEKKGVPIFLQLSFEKEKNYLQLHFFDRGMKWDLEEKLQKKENLPEEMKTSSYGLAIINRLSESFTLKRICGVNETTIRILCKSLKFT